MSPDQGPEALFEGSKRNSVSRENEAKNPFRVSVSPCMRCMLPEPLIWKSTALILLFRVSP
ncbi:hypothetical protein M5K25_025101 [Dendrobium thyrsiflorum]|uniref:Uncharacterized protein n=1 Tax=Dendrobium thyrsiflorum TaxID=117978 RepID=A0ABD0U3Q3_DENTH